MLLVAGAIAFGVLQLTGAGEPDQADPTAIFEATVEPEPSDDPFAWEPGRQEDLERRARAGNSHVLYERSPGGAVASAGRTAEFRRKVNKAASEHGVSADLMEAMVLLESAGRPAVIAGGVDPANASGLAQIVASTGIDLLEMDIDLDESRRQTDRILRSRAEAARLRARASRLVKKGGRRNEAKARRLRAAARDADLEVELGRRARLRADPRFDPEAALDGMARYLEIATERFGREDLAVTSYHMGIGNLSDVASSYLPPEQAELALRDVIDQSDLSYAQLFFDSSPLQHAETWEILGGFADDSATYYWRVLAAREIMRLYRKDPDELRRLAELHGNKATAEEVFHPESETRVFDDPGELEDGIEAGELQRIPSGRSYGFVVGKELGELTDELGVKRSLYRQLRPEALAALVYMAGRVQAITGKHGPKNDLRVTSAARDREYQAALIPLNGEATRSYSLHTTGYSFDILRDYANDAQAEAFQFVLDRMKALNIIDYAREPQAIHVTVSEDARPLLG